MNELGGVNVNVTVNLSYMILLFFAFDVLTLSPQWY